MGGVAVADGATLSATGEMQVTCNAPYVLTVDGVEWVPTASAGGVDTYLLSTSGVVRIFINGTRYFIFTNVISADFSFGSINVQQYSGGTEIKNETSRHYYQGVISENVTSVQMFININSVSPTMSREDLIALGITCIQGNVSVDAASWSNDYVEIQLANFDSTQYNAVFLGNVLLAFFEPRS